MRSLWKIAINIKYAPLLNIFKTKNKQIVVKIALSHIYVDLLQYQGFPNLYHLLQIIGMRSHNGHIVWQHFIPQLAPFDRFGKKKFVFHTQRTTAHFPHPPQCVVLGRNKVTHWIHYLYRILHEVSFSHFYETSLEKLFRKLYNIARTSFIKVNI